MGKDLPAKNAYLRKTVCRERTGWRKVGNYLGARQLSIRTVGRDCLKLQSHPLDFLCDFRQACCHWSCGG